MQSPPDDIFKTDLPEEYEGLLSFLALESSSSNVISLGLMEMSDANASNRYEDALPTLNVSVLGMGYNSTGFNYSASAAKPRLGTDIPIWLIPCYSIILLFAVLGNLLVISTLARNRRMRTITNLFLLNLAISDILLGVLCMPVTLTGTLLRRFIFGEVLCKLIQFLQAVSVAVSSWTLVAISCERYYAICHPLRSRSWQTIKHAYKIIAFIWLGSIICMGPIAVFSQLIPMSRQGLHKCRENWPSVAYERAFNIFLDVTLLVLPLIILCVAYVLITRTLYIGMRNERAIIFTGSSGIGVGAGGGGGIAGRFSSIVGSFGASSGAQAAGELNSSAMESSGGHLVAARVAAVRQTAVTTATTTTARTTITPPQSAGFRFNVPAALRWRARKDPTGGRRRPRDVPTLIHQPTATTISATPLPPPSTTTTTTTTIMTTTMAAAVAARRDDNGRVSNEMTKRSPSDIKCQQQQQDQQHHYEQQQHQQNQQLTVKPSFEAAAATAGSQFQLAKLGCGQPHQHHIRSTSLKSLERHDGSSDTSENGPGGAAVDGGGTSPSQSLKLVKAPTTLLQPKFKQFSQHRRRRETDRRKSNSTPSLRIKDSALRRSNETKNLESKKRVVKMMFVLVLEFFICWSPLYVVNTVSLYLGPTMYEYVDYTFISFCQLLAYSSSCCNPITYCFMNASFRRSFLDTFKGLQMKSGRAHQPKAAANLSVAGNSINMANSVTIMSCNTINESPRL